MARDADDTRRLILDAAENEFARHGFAGARIERISASAGRNRALIYSYFTSKEGLFAAVFDRFVENTTAEVPLDADDLPDYAVTLFDRNREHPEAVRLAQWDRLERGATSLQAEVVQRTNRAKVAAIREAQEAGRITARIPASDLLDLTIALSRMHGRGIEGSDTPAEVSARRDAIRIAMEALVRA